MEIRYDLLSSMDRFMLLENSIKDKLENFNSYRQWFEKIFQIKLLQKIFNVKEICIDEEYEEKKNSLSKKNLKEYLVRCIENLDVVFITEYNETEIIIKCKLEQISENSRFLCFNSYLGGETIKPQYNYVLTFDIKNTEYTGSISIDMPKDNKMINSKLIDENIRQIRKHMDSVLNIYEAYENNKEILENM